MFLHVEQLLDDFTSLGSSLLPPPHSVTSVKRLSVIMLLAAALQSSWAQSKDWKRLLFRREALTIPEADLSKGKREKKTHFQVTGSRIDLFSLSEPLMKNKLK